jgi:hypothetical protein
MNLWGTSHAHTIAVVLIIFGAVAGALWQKDVWKKCGCLLEKQLILLSPSAERYVRSLSLMKIVKDKGRMADKDNPFPTT